MEYDIDDIDTHMDLQDRLELTQAILEQDSSLNLDGDIEYRMYEKLFNQDTFVGETYLEFINSFINSELMRSLFSSENIATKLFTFTFEKLIPHTTIQDIFTHDVLLSFAGFCELHQSAIIIGTVIDTFVEHHYVFEDDAEINEFIQYDVLERRPDLFLNTDRVLDKQVKLVVSHVKMKLDPSAPKSKELYLLPNALMSRISMYLGKKRTSQKRNKMAELNQFDIRKGKKTKGKKSKGKKARGRKSRGKK